ncbi:MAG: glycosyltransferase, partial [Pseudomonadota bacterium]
AKVTAEPHNTTAALHLLKALQNAGAVRDEPGPVRETERIPRQVFQFWDRELPPALADLRERNRALNPGYAYHLFDKVRARAYLEERGGTALTRAFRRAPHPAAMSDIFRLAVLYHEGGLYMDPDDRCVAPLADHLNHGLRFIGYQEYLWSIGNNFLAVAPRDPIIGAALRDVEEAFASGHGETLWLSTGPGLMTRALAAHGVSADGALPDDIWIMPAHRLRRFVSSHVSLPYKSSDQHWTKAIR